MADRPILFSASMVRAPMPDTSDEKLREIPIDPIRICPERDGPCPHGRGCPFWIDTYHCDIAASRALLGRRTKEAEPK